MSPRHAVPAMAAVAALVAAGAQSATAEPARPGEGGFLTAAPSMLAGAAGTQVRPILTVGDTVGGYTFGALPDGISLARVNGRGTVDVLLNHETSKVPFPATRADYANAMLSELRLKQDGAGVTRGEYVIPSSAGYQRFCSNFLAGAAEGFDRPTLFTVEEARDVVLRQEESWRPGLTVDTPGAEQAGVVVAYDPQSGDYRTIYGMGRHNHENALAMRGYGHPVVLSGDDTFDAPASQLYLYTADSGQDVWQDKGVLWAFRSDDPAVNDYGDLTAGDRVSGSFLQVPRAIATGKNADGSEVQAADFGYAPPPSPAIPDGPQWVLEQWSNQHNAFQFIRIEDLAYDRSDDRVLYFADTGEPRAVPDATTGRLQRGSSSTRGEFMNGRIFKMTLGEDPTQGASLEILADFDAGGYNNPAEVHQPDNVETTADAIYVTEDPGSHNKGVTNARVWRIDLATGARTVVAEIDQSSAPVTLPKGEWETSGIVDASSVFGEGAFLINVQAHGWDEQVGEPAYPGGPTPYREKGQLLLMRVPNP
ncbi:hypothetical protein [Nocardioides mesophilus]|uniref:DUF839 domain-containing protein n=1 Tax=Nocardioides mesophilus TaxID=433659 RepID=A0A7G9RCJ6_9ACTN|nr:hypothetical protein [Nocardioides mesophilus]QNN53321.1 hypothetical protein H9L09_02265 [Nocardioides mesophilus]